MRLRSSFGFLWLLVTTAALVAVGVILLSYYAERGRFEAAYSTFRADREGAKALFLWLERLGYTPLRVTEDYTRLRAGGLLFVIAPSRNAWLDEGFDPFEADALDNWVKKGNTVAVFCDGKRQPLPRLNQRLIRGKTRPTFSRPTQHSPLTASVRTLVMRSDAHFRPHKSRTGLQLKWSSVFEDKGCPQVVMARRGRGAYILVADAYPASNVGIVEGDNMAFLLNLVRLYARDAVVWFDEFHHGHAASSGVIAYAKQRSLHYFLIYLLVTVGLGWWRYGTRFGQVLPRWTDPRRESVEYAYAVASVYQAAQMRRYALEMCFNQFKKKLTRFVHHAGAWDIAHIAAQLERKTQHHPRDVVEISQAAEQALRREALSDAEVFQLCRRMAEFEREWLRACIKTAFDPSPSPSLKGRGI
ncbi:MAG: DUF4350 domain-containing protein [Abditibacteriales bacterium]|nr:DUF4350 domain-containing protein [Abditibacteriales bacterium]MDW8364478.1 DUF4350 domain-containing protein [Abditibacteriales bacterium]